MKSRRQTNAERASESSIDNDLEMFRKAEEIEKKRLAKEERKLNDLKDSASFIAMQKVKYVMDEWNLDGILGLFGVGDWLVLILGLPTIYFSLVKLHSIRLTVICMGYFIIDLLVGAIPVVGDIFDFFYRGYKKGYDLIEGYIHNDPEVMTVINKKFWATLIIMGIIICIVCTILYFLFSVIGFVWTHFIELFTA